MLLLILFIIYIVSFFVVRWVYRLHSSKYYDLWNDKDCQLNFTWYIPLFNTYIAILYSIILCLSILELKRKSNKSFNKPKWKIFNWDL
jgi:heme/copper-type cytochrome/quinol oxidase subunit 3